LKKSL